MAMPPPTKAWCGLGGGGTKAVVSTPKQQDLVVGALFGRRNAGLSSFLDATFLMLLLVGRRPEASTLFGVLPPQTASACVGCV